MNTLRGISSIKTPLIEGSKSAVTRSQSLVCANFNDGNDLSKNIFYACDICEGPLVPVSICTICKKATLRSCTKCDVIRNIHSHEACKNLASFASTVSKKYAKDATV